MRRITTDRGDIRGGYKMKNVMLWAGAGQIGMAIARRMGASMKIVVGDKKL